jgi:hypothetical protein
MHIIIIIIISCLKTWKNFKNVQVLKLSLICIFLILVQFQDTWHQLILKVFFYCLLYIGIKTTTVIFGLLWQYLI